ncbi:MAG: DUF3370 domain-containing protein [Cyanobacteriota bacterium]|nr:DUF3370 domain-containing protein [Cyanobacteriota bacterium]
MIRPTTTPARLAGLALLAALTSLPAAAADPTWLRRQTVAPLPGGLDRVLVVNDNNPELISGPGILLSTFSGRDRGRPEAHLDQPLSGRFELFSHHVYAGRPDTLNSTLWLALVAAPRGQRPVTLRLLSGATALSQATAPGQAAAPFLPLPAMLEQPAASPAWSGPGSRVATELLDRSRPANLAEAWTLKPGAPTTLLVLPLPVKGLDPLLNGRNLQLRMDSDGPVDLATLAAFGDGDQPPPPGRWVELLDGPLSPKEHSPTPRGATGKLIYSRVSGVQIGATWSGRITDTGAATLSASRAPISWPIASLERGSLGTAQVQTAELKAAYPGTAWAAHGNYGVLYDLSLPLRNDTSRPLVLNLALESPIKHDQPQGGLRFRREPARAVMFRGTVEVSGLDGGGRRRFHLVQRAGQEGPALGSVSLAPGQVRQLRVRLIYPADATPPQVLSLLPAAGAVKQSEAPPAASP